MKGCFCGFLGAKKDVIVNIGPHVMIFDFYDVCDKASARSTLRVLNALATSILQRYITWSVQIMQQYHPLRGT